MMLLDDRESDLAYLSPALKNLGVDNATCRLDFGDACFIGHGADSSGAPCEVAVGLERKRLNDLISSMQDRRLSGHQLRGMARAYQYTFLFVEGMWRGGDHGAVEIYSGGGWKPYYTRRGGGARTWSGAAISYRQVMNYLTTLELVGGVHVRFTSTNEQTAHQYAALYHWFTEKPWHEHQSCNEIYAKGRGVQRDLPGGRKLAETSKPHFARLVAMQIPHIDGRERYVVKHFGSARAMANATVEEWVNLPWVTKTGKDRRLGPVAGTAAYEAWNSEVGV